MSADDKKQERLAPNDLKSASIANQQIQIEIYKYSEDKKFIGNGKPKDIEKAEKLFNEATQTRRPSRLVRLGVCYQNGTGVMKDLSVAGRCYRLAAQRSIPTKTITEPYLSQLAKVKDLCNSGEILEEKKDFENAVKVYESAFLSARALNAMLSIAKRGDAEDQYRLGICYERGIGVEKDQNKANRLYCLAAAQGHEDASKEVHAIPVPSVAQARDSFFNEIEHNTALRIRPLNEIILDCIDREELRFIKLYSEQVKPIFERLSKMLYYIERNFYDCLRSRALLNEFQAAIDCYLEDKSPTNHYFQFPNHISLHDIAEVLLRKLQNWDSVCRGEKPEPNNPGKLCSLHEHLMDKMSYSKNLYDKTLHVDGVIALQKFTSFLENLDDPSKKHTSESNLAAPKEIPEPEHRGLSV